MSDNITNFKDIYEALEEKGYKIIEITKRSNPIEYICACGEIKIKRYTDIKRKNCRTCEEKKLKETPKDIKPPKIESLEGEEWRAITGGWISSEGRAVSSSGKLLTLCPTKFRYHIGGKSQYAGVLVAKAFEIENNHLLKGDNLYVASHIDGDPSNNRLENIKVLSKSELNSKNGEKSHKNLKKIDIKTMAEIPYITLEEFPDYKIYENGEIYNGRTFLTFSKHPEGYLTLYVKNVGTYKVHRLVCFAFHPIEGKNILKDYDGLQVDHLDGNKTNNHASNLEWVTKEENIKRAYNTNLNKKCRTVLQYSLEDENGDIKLLNEYPSVAKASRETGEKEHTIRELCQGKGKYPARLYNWKFKNEAESKAYSEKYSSKR